MTDVLASDADRDEIAERLRAATADGRLTAEELEERLERAFTARTEAELAPLVADLPAAVAAPAAAATPARPRRRGPDRDHLRAYIAVNVMLVAIWALTGAGYFWPIWPILGWGIGVLSDGGGRLGGPCRRRSSSPASSTGRWPSSPAAGPGSGELLR
jgi:hypothetical protein